MTDGQFSPNFANNCSVDDESEQRICSVAAVKNYSKDDGYQQCPCKTECEKDTFEVRPKILILIVL